MNKSSVEYFATAWSLKELTDAVSIAAYLRDALKDSDWARSLYHAKRHEALISAIAKKEG